jgi:peptide/nickel transport system substrate-binding protein
MRTTIGMSFSRRGAAVVATLILLGLGGLLRSAGAEPTTIRAVMYADLTIFDPIFNTADITSYHALMVFDTLFSLDKDLVARPQMVGEYSVSPDGLSYRFKLRPRLAFHDGSAVTAADVVASLKRWGVRDGAGQVLMKFTKELTAIDDDTVALVLSEPYGLVLESLAKPSANVPVIMPKRLAEIDPFKPVPEVIGSGPFKFKADELVPGNKVVYVKNTAYVPRNEPPSGFAGGKIVKVDSVEWLHMPDGQTAAYALMKGEIDFLEQPSVDFLPVLRGNADIKVVQLNPLGTQGVIRLNHLQPPFDKPAARKAVQWLVNQNDYLAVMFPDRSMAKVCGALLVCGSPWASEEGAEALLSTEPEEQRIAHARALFQEAGYQGEPVVVLDAVDRPRPHAGAALLAESLRKAGVNVQLDAMEFGAMVTRRTKKDPPGQGGWSVFFTSSGGLESSNPAFSVADSAGCEKAWFGWPCDQKIEELRTAWAAARSIEERKKVSVEFQKRAMEVTLYIPHGQWAAPAALRTNLAGMIGVPDSILFWNVEKQ